jgi:hypothetical protein
MCVLFMTKYYSVATLDGVWSLLQVIPALCIFKKYCTCKGDTAAKVANQNEGRWLGMKIREKTFPVKFWRAFPTCVPQI